MNLYTSSRRELKNVEKEGDISLLSFPTLKIRESVWKNNWKQMISEGVYWVLMDSQESPDLYREFIQDKEIYTSEEFMTVLGRLMDDLSFNCEICVSTIGGYREFFHCEKCLIEGGGFVVCHSCMEENEDGYKEHQTEFPGHKMESPDKENLLVLYISSVKECMK